MFFDPMKWARRGWSLGLVLACLAGIGIGMRGLAQTSKSKTAPRDDPGARTLLEQVSKAYRDLSSYSDQGKFVVAMTLGGKAHKRAQLLKLTFVRPNKLDLNAGTVRLTSDGKTLTTVVEPLKKYTPAPAPSRSGSTPSAKGRPERCFLADRPPFRCTCCSTSLSGRIRRCWWTS